VRLPDPDATGRLDVGWREWLTLPDLAIPVIKAKVDTGARTSALHAWRIEPFEHGGAPWIRFHLHPIQRTRRLSIVRTAPVHDRRIVTDSGGHRERRYVISTRLLIGSHARRIELTLTDRDTMLFRMLVGRKGMRGLCILPDQSYLTAPPLSQRAAAANYRAEAEERPRR
jgi:hypothetical protein